MALRIPDVGKKRHAAAMHGTPPAHSEDVV
jgi:hypothetical protein